MKVNLAHVRVPSTSGSPIDYALFESRSLSGYDSDNAELLAQLTFKARASGLKVDQSALAFMESGHLKFYGTKTLVEHLSRNGRPRWTHQIEA